MRIAGARRRVDTGPSIVLLPGERRGLLARAQQKTRADATVLGLSTDTLSSSRWSPGNPERVSHDDCRSSFEVNDEEHSWRF